MTESGVRLHAWIAFQQLVPLLKARIEQGKLPRPIHTSGYEAHLDIDAQPVLRSIGAFDVSQCGTYSSVVAGVTAPADIRPLDETAWENIYPAARLEGKVLRLDGTPPSPSYYAAVSTRYRLPRGALVAACLLYTSPSPRDRS